MKPQPNRYYIRAVWTHEGPELPVEDRYTESFRLDDKASWPSPDPDSWGVYYTDGAGFDHWTEDWPTLERAQEHVRRLNI
jgi:hypothetical protein